MIRRLIREFYLLARGEQRAMLLISALLVLAIGAKIFIQRLPGREPPGWEEFLHESERIMASTGPGETIPAAYPVFDTMAIPAVNPATPPAGRRAIPPAGRPATPPAQSPGSPFSCQVNHVVDINRADSSALLPLPGIGPVFSGRIIRYRELLGGFVHAGQLHDVYGLPPETVRKISSRLLFDPAAIRRIKLNEASFAELLRHPYLEFGDVKALVNYIEFKEAIVSLEEIRENRLLADSTLEKISPYLDTGF